MKLSIPLVIGGMAIAALFGGCQSIKPEAQVTVSEIETVSNSEWKTYTNAKYGYSFQYPSEWRIDARLFDAYQETTSGAAQTEDVVFLTSLTEEDVTQELQELADHQGIDSGWSEVARGHMISIVPWTGTIDGLQSDEFGTWTRGTDITTTNGIVLPRFRNIVTYEQNTDAEHAFLSYNGAQQYASGSVGMIDFMLSHTTDGTEEIQDFEAILKTVRYE